MTSLLLNDLYQLTMAYGYWQSGLAEREACFTANFRTAPFKGGYAIVAGLAPFLTLLENFHFTSEELEYLATLNNSNKQPLFNKEFLQYLSKLRLEITLDAMPEGSVAFANEPIVRIKGPLLQCQLLETPLLNTINFQTLVATKAARICQAARGEAVLELGLRRAHGPDGGLSVSRAAYIGGCIGTSNVLAGYQYGIPVRGTHGHSWVMAFDSELEAFEQYANSFPEDVVLLIDTYDSKSGLANAIIVGHVLKKLGKKLHGIRLDSGDLAYLSQYARQVLDAAGLTDTKIFASNDLDEYIIESLKNQQAAITVWGVGTKLATAYDQAALDGVYKLSAIKNSHGEWQNRIKLSNQLIKISTPGLLLARRYYDQGKAVGDVIYDERQSPDISKKMIDPVDPTRQKPLLEKFTYRELLTTYIKEGQFRETLPSLASSRDLAQQELAHFDPSIRRLLNPHIYPVGIEESLYQEKMGRIQAIHTA